MKTKILKLMVCSTLLGLTIPACNSEQKIEKDTTAANDTIPAYGKNGSDSMAPNSTNTTSTIDSIHNPIPIPDSLQPKK